MAVNRRNPVMEQPIIYRNALVAMRPAVDNAIVAVRKAVGEAIVAVRPAENNAAVAVRRAIGIMRKKVLVPAHATGAHADRPIAILQPRASAKYSIK